MDSITQALLGALTAQLGFRSRIGRDATWVAAAAAVLPDLDILIDPILSLTGAETSELTRITTHRALSHSLLLAPVFSLLVTLLWWRLRRNNHLKPHPQQFRTRSAPPSFLLLYACAFVALLSHPLLDWCTSYGTQLFSPLTERRYALDAVPIIDIFYSPLLILTLILCYLLRKLQSPRLTLIVAWLGFLLSVAYLAAGLAAHRYAIHLAHQHLPAALAAASLDTPIASPDSPVPTSADLPAASSDQPVPASDSPAPVFHAYPQLGTIFLWRVTARTPDHWLAFRVNLLYDRHAPSLPAESAPLRRHPALDLARTLPEAQTFHWFAMDQTRATVSVHPDHILIDFNDMRYGLSPTSLQSLWALRVTLDPQLNPLDVEWLRHHRRFSAPQLLRQAWQNIWSPSPPNSPASPSIPPASSPNSPPSPSNP